MAATSCSGRIAGMCPPRLSSVLFEGLLVAVPQCTGMVELVRDGAARLLEHGLLFWFAGALEPPKSTSQVFLAHLDARPFPPQSFANFAGDAAPSEGGGDSFSFVREQAKKELWQRGGRGGGGGFEAFLLAV